MTDTLKDRRIEKRPDRVRLRGRILFLTEDPELIKKQLDGWDLPWDAAHPENRAARATPPTASRHGSPDVRQYR